MIRRQNPRGGLRPPVKPTTYRGYRAGIRVRKPDIRNALVPLALIGFVTVLATTLILVIIVRGPDTHTNLWNEAPEGYSRTTVRYVVSLPAPPALSFIETALPQEGTTLTPSPRPEEISFSGNILPIFQAQCMACHGRGISFKGVSLTSYQAITDTQAHAPLFVPGKPEESLLVDVLRGKRTQMPPTGPLPEEQIGMIEDWIRQGGQDN